MASMSVSEDNLSCHECCEVVVVDDNDPVFSRNGCMRSYWETKGGSRGRSPTKLEPPFNLNLKSLLESFVKEGSSQTGVLPCPLHHATLKFYCEADKQLMCVMCRDSKLHKYHSFSHIEDAAKGRKETLKKASLRPLKDKLKRFNDMRLTCDKAAQHLKVQAQQTEKQIKQNFEKLHQFLRDEEAARIAALMEEEEKKSQIIKEKIEEMSRDISSLSNTIRALEEEMKADDVTFLQNYNATVERAQCTLPAPERLPQGALINVAKHLGNLKFRVWEKMKALIHYTPVILDPNTAHSQLVLSKDMAGLTYNSQRQQVPDNPERLDRWCVLGAEGFDSGRHWWDVEIYDSGKGSWYLGLLTESSMRDARGSPWSGFWCLFKHHGKYSARCPGSSDILIAMEEKPQKPRVQMDWVKGKFWSLWSGYCGQVNYYVKYDAHSPAVSPLLIKLKQKPQKIRVQLDWDRGQLTFSNPDNNRHLHTFPYPFTERMFPCFYAYNCSLRVVPVRPAVILKQLC